MKNKFKIIAVILAIICVTSIAYGCGKNATEDTSNTPSIAITASAAQQSNLEFELVSEQVITSFQKICFWRELSTDTMYVETIRSSRNGYGSGLTQMLDPETGKPLTYAQWSNTYK